MAQNEDRSHGFLHALRAYMQQVPVKENPFPSIHTFTFYGVIPNRSLPYEGQSG